MGWLERIFERIAASIIADDTVCGLTPNSWLTVRKDEDPSVLTSLRTLAGGIRANSQAVGPSKVEPGRDESRTTVNK